MIFGLIFGLLGAPLILYFLGSIIVLFKTNINQEKLQKMKQEHNKEIENLRKQYEKERKKFNSIHRRLQRMISNAKAKKQRG